MQEMLDRRVGKGDDGSERGGGWLNESIQEAESERSREVSARNQP